MMANQVYPAASSHFSSHVHSPHPMPTSIPTSVITLVKRREPIEANNSFVEPVAPTVAPAPAPRPTNANPNRPVILTDLLTDPNTQLKSTSTLHHLSPLLGRSFSVNNYNRQNEYYHYQKTTPIPAITATIPLSLASNPQLAPKLPIKPIPIRLTPQTHSMFLNKHFTPTSTPQPPVLSPENNPFYTLYKNNNITIPSEPKIVQNESLSAKLGPNFTKIEFNNYLRAQLKRKFANLHANDKQSPSSQTETNDNNNTNININAFVNPNSPFQPTAPTAQQPADLINSIPIEHIMKRAKIDNNNNNHSASESTAESELNRSRIKLGHVIDRIFMNAFIEQTKHYEQLQRNDQSKAQMLTTTIARVAQSASDSETNLPDDPDEVEYLFQTNHLQNVAV